MNYYARAIELLQEEQDWKAIAFDYAKKYPSAFVRAANDSKPLRPTDKWVPKAAELLRSGYKIEAIKLCRSETGMGLKEAKEYVESLAKVAS